MRIPFTSRILAVLTIALTVTPSLRAQQTLQTALRAKLETQMGNVAEGLNGVMGYAIKDLSSGETFLRLPDTVFPQASSIKLTVLLELMRQAQQGKLSLEERHTLRRSEMTVGGHGAYPYDARRRHCHPELARSRHFHGGAQRQHGDQYPYRSFGNG